MYDLTRETRGSNSEIEILKFSFWETAASFSSRDYPNNPRNKQSVTMRSRPSHHYLKCCIILPFCKPRLLTQFNYCTINLNLNTCKITNSWWRRRIEWYYLQAELFVPLSIVTPRSVTDMNRYLECLTLSVNGPVMSENNKCVGEKIMIKVFCQASLGPIGAWDKMQIMVILVAVWSWGKLASLESSSLVKIIPIWPLIG